ncbi:hypothetical protein DWUX_1051 [Desulfovibrio diazotrophicus]|nr:hypothetical protein DWUX_1051 [Desulfovibrio diazotrophicus]
MSFCLKKNNFIYNYSKLLINFLLKKNQPGRFLFLLQKY